MKEKPKSLAEIFEEFAQPDDDGFSRAILVEDLVQADPRFGLGNGGSWCRDDGPLGRKYHVLREKKPGCGNRIVWVKLDGLNNTPKEKPISAVIVREISKQRCAVLDIGAGIECDHKNGRYDSRKVASLSQQELSDFQPLSKAVNVAKRQHCKECQQTGMRYDARRLGYAQPFLKGDESSKTCVGCYWYDPQEFNRVVSKDFQKKY